jgi:hypothetical protein
MQQLASIIFIFILIFLSTMANHPIYVQLLFQIKMEFSIYSHTHHCRFTGNACTLLSIIINFSVGIGEVVLELLPQIQVSKELQKLKYGVFHLLIIFLKGL